jgi:hypothetical protein
MTDLEKMCAEIREAGANKGTLIIKGNVTAVPHWNSKRRKRQAERLKRQQPKKVKKGKYRPGKLVKGMGQQTVTYRFALGNTVADGYGVPAEVMGLQTIKSGPLYLINGQWWDDQFSIPDSAAAILTEADPAWADKPKGVLISDADQDSTEE